MDFLRLQAIRMYELTSGRQLLSRMQDLDRNQWLSREDLLTLQQHKLYRLLSYAGEHVPYYRRLFDEAGFEPCMLVQDPANLQRVPFLTKDLVRKHLDDLVTTEPKLRAQLSQLSTAGSTGQPLIFYQDPQFRSNNTAELHHHLSWSGWRLGEPHAYIFGASFEASLARNLRAQLMSWSLNRFVTNAYVLSEESMHRFAAQAMRRRPRLLFGYASSLYRFAQFLREHKAYNLDFVDSVFTTSEVLYPAQRELIQEVLGCQVFNRYATRELGVLACECAAHTGLHVSTSNVYVEILKDGVPTQPGESGDIFVTNLNNYGMPFIRYQLADLAAWHPLAECPCGRAHPMIRVVEGRHNDMFKTRDGRLVWGGIGNPLWNVQGVDKFQFIQKTYDDVLVKIVKDEPLSEAQQAEVYKAVRTALGEQVRVDFEYLDDIPVARSGKHRYQICEVD